MIKVITENTGKLNVDKIPKNCPYCNNLISPILFNGRSYKKNIVELFFICPDSECNKSFIAVYSTNGNIVYQGDGSGSLYECFFMDLARYTLKGINFPDSIVTVSPAFISIYDEAHKAEQLGLKQICGVGYRKALEFLIKDYIIYNDPSAKESVQNIFIGKCIQDFVSDPKIKLVASRAVWLGNDETHYVRKWEDKDLSDLVNLIELTLHWIEMERLTDEIGKDMPDKQ